LAPKNLFEKSARKKCDFWRVARFFLKIQKDNSSFVFFHFLSHIQNLYFVENMTPPVLSPFEVFLSSNASIDIMKTHVFPHIYVSDQQVLSNVSRVINTFMMGTANKELRLYDFSNSVPRMLWLRAQGYAMHSGNKHVCGRAAADGNMTLLKWLSTNNLFEQSITTEKAALHGHLDVLVWLKEDGKCVLQRDAYSAAAKGGHIHILEWMLVNGWWTSSEDAFVAAAKGNHQNVVDWLLYRGDKIPHIKYMAAAAGSGALEMLKLHVTQLNAGIYDQDIVPGYRGLNPGFRLASSVAVLNNAAGGGHTSVLEWLQTLPNPNTLRMSQALSLALVGGHKNTALWLLKHGWPLTTSNALEAAATDDIDMLIWLRKIGCPWNKDTIACEASRKRNRQMFEWVISQPKN
jgi:hypothetical protein